MKKIIGVFLLLFLTILTACSSKDAKITEKVLTKDNGTVIYYPVVETGNPGVDKAINKEIENAVFTQDDEGNVEQGYTALQNKELLSVFIEGMSDTDSYMKTLHINTKTGKRYNLYDIIKEEEKSELERIVNEELETRLAEYKLAYKPNVETAAFDVFNNRLVFIFNPGSIAPIDMGFIDISLDFERIDHILDKSGELYKIAQK